MIHKDEGNDLCEVGEQVNYNLIFTAAQTAILLEMFVDISIKLRSS